MYGVPRSKRWRVERGQMHSRVPKSHVHTVEEDDVSHRFHKVPQRTRNISNFEFVENDFPSAHEDPQHSRVYDAEFGTAGAYEVPRGYDKRSRRSRGFDARLDRGEQGDTRGRRLKHPPHLRGREIGLFYAKMNKERRNGSGEKKEILVSASCGVKYDVRDCEQSRPLLYDGSI